MTVFPISQILVFENHSIREDRNAMPELIAKYQDKIADIRPEQFLGLRGRPNPASGSPRARFRF